MSAVFPADAAKYLSAAISSLANPTAVLCWYKPLTAYDSTSRQTCVALKDATNALNLAYDEDAGTGSAPAAQALYNAGSVATADYVGSSPLDAWMLLVGYFRNSATPYRAALAAKYGETPTASNYATSSVTAGLSLASVTGIWIGLSGASSFPARGRLAHVCLLPDRSTLSDSELVEAMTKNPTTWSFYGDVDHYWTLESGLTATKGGVTLTNNGSVSFDADMPSLTGGSAILPKTRGLFGGPFARLIA